MTELVPKLANAVDMMFEAQTAVALRVRESLALKCLAHIVGTRNLDFITEYYLPRTPRFATSDALYENALNALFSQLGLRFGQLARPQGPMEDFGTFLTEVMEVLTKCRAAQEVTTDKIMRDDMTMGLVGLLPLAWGLVAQSPGWDPEIIPPSELVRAMRIYKYERSHNLYMDKGDTVALCTQLAP